MKEYIVGCARLQFEHIERKQRCTMLVVSEVNEDRDVRKGKKNMCNRKKCAVGNESRLQTSAAVKC